MPLTDNFMPGVPLATINQALAEASLPVNEIRTTFCPLLIQRGKFLTLIDTGFGPDAGRREGSTVGQLFKNLNDIAVSPDDIKLVIISHFHPDHVGGLVTEGAPAFKNAEIAVPRVEWEFWMDDAAMQSAPHGRMSELFTNNRRVFSDLRDRLRIYDWDSDVTSGIQAVGTPGHSIGHTSFIIESNGERVFVQSDLTSQEALFVRHPEWTAFVDQDPVLAVKTRRWIYEMLARDRIRVQGFHHPYPGLSFVEKTPTGYALVPAL